jgi:hypothetical protein
MKTLNLSAIALIFLSTLIFSCQKTAPVSDRKPPVVNAGPSQSVILPLDSVLLSGRATDSSSSISAYLWSEVSGPNVPVIENEGSPSTLVTGLIKGTYIFQLMAIDSFGLTGVDTMSVVVSYSQKNNEPVTLSPIDNPNEYTWIGNTSGDFSEGPFPKELGAEAWTVGGAYVAVRSGFRFDLSNLSNTAIASAHLTLYSNPTPGTANLTTPNYGTSDQFFIQRINSSWSSTSNGTWATQPTTDTTAEVLIPQTNLSSLDLPNIDVTQLVKNMIASGNYGFMIRLQNEVTYNSRIFCSSSYSDSTKRPVLVISY